RHRPAHPRAHRRARRPEHDGAAGLRFLRSRRGAGVVAHDGAHADPAARAGAPLGLLVDASDLARQPPRGSEEDAASAEGRRVVILQPMSDVHADFPGFKGYPAPVPGASVIVVAGDTRQGLAVALRELRAAYPPPLEVVVVAGNHEFWSRAALPAAIDEGRRVAADLGLHYLENDVAVIGGA